MRLISLTLLALRRLANQRALTACLLLGMTVAVAIASAIPAFVSSAQNRVLRRELADRAAGQIRLSGLAANTRLPLSLKFSYLGFGRALLNFDETRELDAYMAERVAPRLGLPVVRTVRYMSTDLWTILPANETWRKYPLDDSQPLGYASLDFMTDLLDHIDLDAGRLPAGFPGAPPVTDDGEIEVMVGRGFSAKTGIQAGDAISLTRTETTLVASDLKTSREVQRVYNIIARVTGVWAPKNGNDTYWIIRPDVLEKDLTLSPDTMGRRIGPIIDRQFSLMIWAYEVNDKLLTAENVGDIVDRANALNAEAFEKNEQLTLNQFEIISALRSFLRQSQELTLLMALFCAPIFAVVLSFVVLVAGMVVRQQEGELAILRSRGASPLDIFYMYAAQGVLLALIAVLIGVPLSFGVASLLASAITFLQFAPQPEWVTSLPPLSLRLAVAAAVVGAAATLLPALGAARRTILGFGAERARSAGRPLWQRAWLDVLLLIPCAYATWQLRQAGSLVVFGTDVSQADPFRDPIRYLLPILTLTAAGLLASRFVPRLFGLLAALVSRIQPLTPIFLALRDLARSPKDYAGALLLLIFTLGIAAYGASLARTLDQHLIDTIYLDNGGDLRLIETGVSNKPDRPPGVPGQAPVDDTEPEYMIFEPPEGHLEIAGIKRYARAARIPVRARIAANQGSEDKSMLLAIDREEFSRIAAKGMRDDYSYAPMGEIVNRLAARPDAVLVERRFFADNGLSIGGKLVLSSGDFRAPGLITYTVADLFDIFPIVAGSDAPFKSGNFFVANAGYTFESLSKELPYDIVAETDPGVSVEKMVQDAQELGFIVINAYDARTRLLAEQQRPERQGLFGALTAGFLFMTALTVLGFAIYALLSFRRRAIELGVLRALGLSEAQTSIYVVGIQGALTLVGALVGTSLGVALSYIYVPAMQATGKLITLVPPFLTRMAWDNVALIYLALATALGFVIAASLGFLRRLRAFEAIKLGAV